MSEDSTDILRSLQDDLDNQPPRETVWDGPCSDSPKGGVTFSLLSRFLCCRERFRIYAIEGLRAREGFNHKIEYGNMWHCCEEAHASIGRNPTRRKEPAWELALDKYAGGLCALYPTEQERVRHWYNICRIQFPIYLKHWGSGLQESDKLPLLAEHVFCIPYQLPSKRTVYLKGKWDKVDLEKVYETNTREVWLQENKTKGDVKPAQIARQLRFDLQTMLYLIALHEEWKQGQEWSHVASSAPIAGVRYNVVRRPLSGGKHNISRHKATAKKFEETEEHFYARLGGLIKGDPEHFFLRFKVGVSKQDIDRFRMECLDPILEQLCDWWEYIAGNSGYCPFQAMPGMHFTYPYGVFNPALEGLPSALDTYLETGNAVGLDRCDTVFPELR